MEKLHDVIVVGAGPGGAAVSHYLAQQGLDIVMLDKSDFPRDKTCGDCLTPRALDVLQDMGILEEVNQVSCRINRLEVHGARGNFMDAPIPQHSLYPNHMLVSPRLQLDDLIRKRAVSSGADFHSPVQVRNIEQYDDHVIVKGRRAGENVQYKGRLVILAVGAHLKLLYKLGILAKQPGVIIAARGYFDDLVGLEDSIQAHFDSVPLPGYGWVFPVSESIANIGIGYWRSWNPFKKAPTSARTAFDHFITKNPKVRTMMANAKAIGAVKSFPLRVDFASAPTRQGRILLIGEAAGLVSPLTGEGIDFALESGKMSAEFIGQVFNQGTMATKDLEGYDKLLRSHFQRLFVFLTYMRRLYINPLLMDKAITAAHNFPELKDTLMKVMMSETDAASMVNLSTIRKIILGV